MLQDQQCLWESEDDFKNVLNFQPVLTPVEHVAETCFDLGTPLVFPIQEVIAENIEPSVFVIHGLPTHDEY